MYKVVFVVLHFKTKPDTIRCVESLKNIIYKNKEIVIVDNGSRDGSGEELQRKYEAPDCHVIISKKNNGFARGNNLGFDYAKNTLEADFIVLLNNDTFIEQLEFVDIMIKKYNGTQFYVCGPDIIDRLSGGGHLNPQRQYNTTFFGMLHFRRACIRKIISTYSPKFKLVNSIDSENKAIKPFVAEDIEGCMLQGSCLIFSPLYIEKYNGLYAGTFMYLEEDILKLQMDILGHKMLYAHELKVNHLGQSSTMFVCPDYKKRFRKRHVELVKSSLHYNWIIIKMKFSVPFFIQWIRKKLQYYNR